MLDRRLGGGGKGKGKASRAQKGKGKSLPRPKGKRENHRNENLAWISLYQPPRARTHEPKPKSISRLGPLRSLPQPPILHYGSTPSGVLPTEVLSHLKDDT